MPFVLIPFIHIINHSISSSCFPSQWKQASVAPIRKKAQASEPKYFRTMSTYSTDPSCNSITFDRYARSLNDIPCLKRQSKQSMEQYTPRERSEIVEIYIQQNKSIVKTQRAFKN